MIFLLSYLSGGYKVKGYLALPVHLQFKKEDVQSWLTEHYQDSDFPVQEIACRVSSSIVESYSIELDTDKNYLKSNINKFPVFLYCRGGRGKFGRVKIEWLEQFTQEGYIVFAPCYRGNEGGEGSDEFGGAEQEDVLSAYRFLQSLPFVDSKRISVMGFSRGAINATQLVVQVKDVHRLILWSGVSDLAQTYRERSDLRRMLRKVVGGTPDKYYPAYRERSPVALADDIECPVLIIHGTEDSFVNYQHGLNMYKRLNELGLQVDMHAYEGKGHLFPYPIHLMAVERMFQWIDAP